MQVTSVNGTTANTSSAATGLEQMLGKDAFLKLLITQIRFQDPLQPLEDKEFIAQLAQFSSLEQMQQINAGFAATQLMTAGTQALSLVGKHITAVKPGVETPIEGVVEGVSFRDGTPVLKVGGEAVQLSWVAEVR